MIYVLVGASGAGKSTIEKKVEKQLGDRVERIVSITTRPPRDGEKDGVDYHFITDGEFFELLNKDKLLEHTIYRAWRYGISSDGLDYKNKIYLAVIEPYGYRQIKNKIGNYIKAIYINVPERERMIRLLNRNDDIDELIRRVLSDRDLFKNFQLEADYIINNNNVDKAVDEIIEIITKNK